MRKRIDDLSRFYNEVRVYALKGSSLYKFFLDGRHNLFNSEKFINDPWSGDALIGKNILDGNFLISDCETSFDIFKAIKCESGLKINELEYINSFVWIRDLQTIGGNNSRKFVRTVISNFIEENRKKKMFWLLPSWNVKITSERIVNWMMSFSFFASGADDKFQKEVLYSISEQFSHIKKVYKVETDFYTVICALKAMFFCFCSMKGNQKRSIKSILSEIYEVVEKSIDEFGMIFSKNPVDQFNMLRCLLEIRFMARSLHVDIENDFFYKKLSEMASCVRFLRLGDGKLSGHHGNSVSSMFFIPRSNIIDTALSLVDIHHFDEKNNKVPGFERITTKKTTVIVNTEVFSVRSRFNPMKEPGINIFDFDASFSTDRLINRSDISLFSDGYYMKFGKSSDVFFKKRATQDKVCFESEARNFRDRNQFAVRREISLSNKEQKINVSEFCFCSKTYTVCFRIVFDKSFILEKISHSLVSVKNSKNEYLFQLESSTHNRELLIFDSPYPTVYICVRNVCNEEIQSDWSLEKK